MSSRGFSPPGSCWLCLALVCRVPLMHPRPSSGAKGAATPSPPPVWTRFPPLKPCGGLGV
ncbi:hypothetical protein B0H12DRAFT_1136462 [Mycena haematopus]|nr:hypothetical protein B0H12DRAFT_1136462 [Mycena haematopus]